MMYMSKAEYEELVALCKEKGIDPTPKAISRLWWHFNVLSA